jgi:uncharacterized protein (DUF433 family)
METIQAITLIATNPAVRDGRPCVKGTGLRVTDIVMAHLLHRRSPGDIAADYDISLAAVHAALAYYYQHKEELDADIRQLVIQAKQAKEQNLGSRRDSLLSR